MNFTGTGRRLESGDLLRAAELLRCDVATIRAVLTVEARGSGFDQKNRPTILFEPHVFYRLLGNTPERVVAVQNGVAYLKWRTKPYPASADGRYRQLDKAVLIDQDKALKSASWGLGQVMGFNHARAGYETAEALVRGAMESEGEQLMAMCRYIRSARLDDELREHRWMEFARGYNGPQFMRNAYDVKLADAYKRYMQEGSVNA